MGPYPRRDVVRRVALGVFLAVRVSPIVFAEVSTRPSGGGTSTTQQLEEALFLKGIDLAQDGNYQEASEQFSRVLKNNPFNYYASDFLKLIEQGEQGVLKKETLTSIFHGAKAFWSQDYPTAARHVEKALQLDPEYAFAYDFYGTILFTSGLADDEVLSYFKKALELDPKDPHTHEHIGFVYYFAHRYQEAKESLEKAKQTFQTEGDTQELQLVEDMLKQVNESLSVE